MTKQNTTTESAATVSAREIYREFLDNMLERAESAAGNLTDHLTAERDVDKILAMQQELKRAARKVDILNRLHDGIRPIDLLEIIGNVAEPEVREDLQPMFDVISDLRCALNLTHDDIRAIAEREA